MLQKRIQQTKGLGFKKKTLDNNEVLFVLLIRHAKTRLKAKL